jgi:hypothetical protein
MWEPREESHWESMWESPWGVTLGITLGVTLGSQLIYGSHIESHFGKSFYFRESY